jgi:hypothetical protein
MFYIYHELFFPCDYIWFGKCIDSPVETVVGTQDAKLESDDSAMLQSMQWIINVAYNQRSLQSTPLYTA